MCVCVHVCVPVRVFGMETGRQEFVLFKCSWFTGFRLLHNIKAFLSSKRLAILWPQLCMRTQDTGLPEPAQTNGVQCPGGLVQAWGCSVLLRQHSEVLPACPALVRAL